MSAMSETPYTLRRASLTGTLFDRASVVNPGGLVNSPVPRPPRRRRYPRFMVSGQGPYLTDADGPRVRPTSCAPAVQ
ncbi:hypothetical protein GCM10017687_03810 [Streptomyces echinatus]